MNRDIDLLVDVQSGIELDLDVSHVGGGAENVIEVIQKNGVALPVEDKTVNIEVPTDADIESLIDAHGFATKEELQPLLDTATDDDVFNAFDLAILGEELPEEEKGKNILLGGLYKIASLIIEMFYDEFGSIWNNITRLQDGKENRLECEDGTISIERSGGYAETYPTKISATNVILTSPNGTRYKIAVDDNGNLTTTAI